MGNDNTRKNVAVADSKQPSQFMRKLTQKQQVLSHLKMVSGSGMTSLDAIEQYKCTRLAHWIYVLRNEGYNILTIDEPNTTNTGIHARYILISEPINPTAA